MYYDSLRLECSSALQETCVGVLAYVRRLCIMTRFTVNVVHLFRRRVAIVHVMTHRLCIMTRFRVNIVGVLTYVRRLCIMTRFSLNVVPPFRTRHCGCRTFYYSYVL